MREHGVRVLSPRGDFTAHPHVTDNPAEVGEADFVFLGLKANSYASRGPLLARSSAPERRSSPRRTASRGGTSTA